MATLWRPGRERAFSDPHLHGNSNKGNPIKPMEKQNVRLTRG